MQEVREFEVVFDQADGVCHAGSKVSGTVIMDLAEPIQLTKLYLWFYGKAEVHYMVTKIPNQHTSLQMGAQMHNYKIDETYFDEKINILYGSPGNTMQAGRSTYQFEFPLAGNLPSSYEGKHGHVRYFCKAVIEKPDRSYELKRPFTVLRALDLNMEAASLRRPMENGTKTDIQACCVSGGVTASFQVNRGGFVPGESIYISAEVVNSSGSTVSNVRVALKQNIHFLGRSDSMFSSKRLKSEFESVIIAHFKAPGKIGKNASGKWNNVGLQIPAVPPSRLEGCDIIKIAYVIEFQAEVSYGKNISMPLDVVIGSVPLSHAQPAGPTSGPITQQPTPSAPPGYADVAGYQAPPPSYEESVMGRQDISEDHDSTTTRGNLDWAPRYPMYNTDTRHALSDHSHSQGIHGDHQGVSTYNHNSGADSEKHRDDFTGNNPETNDMEESEIPPPSESHEPQNDLEKHPNIGNSQALENDTDRRPPTESHEPHSGLDSHQTTDNSQALENTRI